MQAERKASTGSYRGEDRRRGARARDGGKSLRDPTFRVALAVCVFASAALLCVGLLVEAERTAIEGLDELLAALSAALVLVAAALCGLRWRVSGAAPSLWASASLTVVSLHVGLRHLVPVVRDHGPLVAAASGGSLVVAVALVARARRSADVDAALRPTRVVAVATLATVVATGALHLLGLGVPPLAVDGVVDRPGTLVLLAAWVAMASIGTRRDRGAGGGWTFAGIGLLGAAFALHKLVVLALGLGERAPTEGHLLLLLVGALIVAGGSGSDLQAAFAHQRLELLRSQATADVALERAGEARRLVEERSHEARNALTAIDGATKTLERNHGLLPEETRAALAQAVSAEVARLQLLIAGDVPSTGATAFDVAEAIAPAVTGARAGGLLVEVDVPGGLVASGSWADTAAVVQNLLENVRRHAGGSSALVRGRAVEGRILVHVDDRGPGLPRQLGDTVFERGVRGPASEGVPGSGLGLHLARQAMLRQGGDLRYLARPGGGASLEVELIAAVASGGGVGAPPRVDVLDDLLEAGDVEAGGHGAGGRRVVLLGRQAQDDLGGEPGR